MGTHRLLEHTADMGIEANGETLEELFAQAAYGLLEIIAGVPEAVSREEKSVTLKGGDTEELLVNWLNEILYLFEIQGFFPLDFEVEEVGWNRLRARVRGEPFDPRRHVVEREVKAVTYHRLRVEKTDGLWHAAQESVWDMTANTFRPLGYTSADAAGLSLLAGLARPDEGLPVSQGGQCSAAFGFLVSSWLFFRRDGSVGVSA